MSLLTDEARKALVVDLLEKAASSQLSQFDMLLSLVKATEKAILEITSPSVSAPFDPTEEQWGGLARQLILAYQLNFIESTSLIRFLNMTGCRIPDWLANDVEVATSKGVLSKGTRAVLVYKAMLDPECTNSKFRKV